MTVLSDAERTGGSPGPHSPGLPRRRAGLVARATMPALRSELRVA